MRTFSGAISTNKVGSDCSFEFEVDDDATEDQIEQAGLEAAFQLIDWYFVEIKD